MGGREKKRRTGSREQGGGGGGEGSRGRAGRIRVSSSTARDSAVHKQTDRRAHPREGVVETRAAMCVCVPGTGSLGQDHWDRGKIAIALGWAGLANWRCRREARWPWLEVDLRPARCVGPVDQIMTLGGGTRASRRSSVSLCRRAAVSLCLPMVRPWLPSALLSCACVLVGSWSGRQPGLREHRGCRDALRCGAVRVLRCCRVQPRPLCLRFGVGQYRALAGTGRTGKGWARIPRSGQPPEMPQPQPRQPPPHPQPGIPILCSSQAPPSLPRLSTGAARQVPGQVPGTRYQVPGARCARRHHVARPISGVFSFPSNQQLPVPLSFYTNSLTPFSPHLGWSEIHGSIIYTCSALVHECTCPSHMYISYNYVVIRYTCI